MGKKNRNKQVEKAVEEETTVKLAAAAVEEPVAAPEEAVAEVATEEQSAPVVEEAVVPAEEPAPTTVEDLPGDTQAEEPKVEEEPKVVVPEETKAMDEQSAAEANDSFESLLAQVDTTTPRPVVTVPVKGNQTTAAHPAVFRGQPIRRVCARVVHPFAR